MKTLIITSALLFLINLPSFAFQTDSTKVQMKEKERERERVINNSKQNEKPQLGEKKNINNGKRKMDVFIDKDGDGISDQRASGMGLDNMRKRFRAGKGSGGKGSGQDGSGGSGSGGNGNGGSGGR